MKRSSHHFTRRQREALKAKKRRDKQLKRDRRRGVEPEPVAVMDRQQA